MPKSKRVVFVRHANTNKAAVDLDRTITEEVGRGQAIEARQKLQMIKFDRAFCSCALRTKQTAEIILVDGAKIEPLDVLYRLPDAEGEKVCNEMFAELGYAALRKYLEHKDAETLRRFGKTAAQALATEDESVLIVSHAVLINAIAYEMFPGVKCVQDLMLDANLPECGIVEVMVAEDGSITAQIL